MKLTDTAVRNAKPDSLKIRRLYDGRGLYLEISPKGKKGWRFKYRFDDREKRISLGIYPDVKLAYARQQKEQARELLAKGIDPSEQRKTDKLERRESNRNTFEAVARAWFDSRKINWSESHQVKVFRILKKNLFPWIGKTPIRHITPQMLLNALRHTEKQGKYETAMKAKQIAGQVFCYGVVTGKAERDITPDLRGALTSPRVKHRAAIIEPKEVGRLMLAIDAYQGTPEVCCALRLAPLTFVRPGELRHAEWSEIDWEESLWRINAEKMKMKHDHIVPLSRQSLEILHDIHRLTGNSRYIFPSARSPKRPMSENAVLVALRTMGYSKEQMTGHGFRAMARTLLDEQLGYRIDWIEQQLAHSVRDAHGRAYNRTTHLEGRCEMMQAWADYLDELKTGAEYPSQRL